MLPYTALTLCRRSVFVRIFCAISLPVLAACSSLAGPDYERPQVDVGEAWSLNNDVQDNPAQAIQIDWWTGFRDPYLDGLVQKAIAGNFDIRILAARIDAAEIGLEQEELTGKPTLSLNASAEQRRSPAPVGATQSYAANLSGLNWELDLWGKTRKGVRAQQAEYKASEADYRAGYLTITADVANTYFEIRQLDQQIERQRSSLRQNETILAIFQAQEREGLVSATRVLQQKAELRSLSKDLLELERQRAVRANTLATLLGVPAGSFTVPDAALETTVQTPQVPAGLPSDLLARRPDILAAEYRVLKAHELVGQARLAKLPSVTLTGSGGLASALLSGLLSGWTLGIGAAVNIPIFDPSLDLQIESNQVQQRIAEEEYRKTVITAFEEVENALLNLASRKEQRRELEQQIKELQTVNAAINAQLREGIVSQLEVFESERSLLTARQALLQADHDILRDTVILYKALGGGWPRETVQLAGY